MASNQEIAEKLRDMAVNTGTLNCLGCGFEHNCSVHGCAVLKQAAELISQPNEPLTPEMLKEMVQEAGKPVVVWTVNIEDDGSLDLDSGEWEMFDGVDFSAPNTLDDLSHYGQRGYFVAYRRPPKGENHHG